MVKRGIQKKFYKKKFSFHFGIKFKKECFTWSSYANKKPQDKFLSVLKGKVLDVAVDLRKNSKTYGKHFKIILSEKNGKHLFVPKGFAHGILGLDKENILHYACSNYRDPKSEVSIKWNDTDLKINWGIKKPIISKKDKLALSFKDFKKNKK